MDLNPLKKIAEAEYEQKRQAFARIINEESILRNEINRIASLDQPPSQSGSGIDHMRAIGADVLWQGWLTRSKISLNMKLAQVLARKEAEQQHVRQAFGKLTALNTLIEENKIQQRRKMSKAILSAAIDQAVIFKVEDQ